MQNSLSKSLVLRATCAALFLAASSVWAQAAPKTEIGLTSRFHPPITQQGDDTTPRPYNYQAPQPLALPSGEELKTITVKDRNFQITHVAKASDIIKSKKPEVQAQLETAGLALYQTDDEALFFKGTGGGGLKSKERLIVENCTFTLDFNQGNVTFWEPRRTAIFVDGYREVVIRNCVFVSMMKLDDPVRKVNSSINAQDCLNVQIENCYFEGLTNWMRGHVTVFACGPTSITNCEVAGQRQGNNWACGGGIWVANGIGEGKLGTPMHADKPELMIYPSGPLLIDQCNVHDQKGTLNTDGIYVQSIHPFLIRNSRVSNWGDDSLIDVGFRDSAKGNYNGQRLVNHGAIGVIENCEFEGGYIKDSVGAGGGIVFRNNLVKNAWFFPYVFDGGSWYVTGNRIEDLTGPLISGYNYGTSGWAPPEGMLIGGSKYYFYNNFISTRAGVSIPALYVSTPIATSALKGNVIADFNTYALPSAPQLWADDRSVKRQDATLTAWQTATGNDKHSQIGAFAPTLLQNAEKTPVSYPGNLPTQWGRGALGPTAPLGPSASLKSKAQILAMEVRAKMELNASIGSYPAEYFRVSERRGNDWIHPNKDAEGGQYRLWEAKNGDWMRFEITVFEAGTFSPRLKFYNQSSAGQLQLAVDGQDVGAPVALAPAGTTFAPVKLGAGNHWVTLTLQTPAAEKTNVRFDTLELTKAP